MGLLNIVLCCAYGDLKIARPSQRSRKTSPNGAGKAAELARRYNAETKNWDNIDPSEAEYSNMLRFDLTYDRGGKEVKWIEPETRKPNIIEPIKMMTYVLPGPIIKPFHKMPDPLFKIKPFRPDLETPYLFPLIFKRGSAVLPDDEENLKIIKLITNVLKENKDLKVIITPTTTARKNDTNFYIDENNEPIPTDDLRGLVEIKYFLFRRIVAIILLLIKNGVKPEQISWVDMKDYKYETDHRSTEFTFVKK